MSKTTILETIIEIIKEYGINIDVKSLDFNMPMKKNNLLTKITTINELIDVCEKLSNSN